MEKAITAKNTAKSDLKVASVTKRQKQSLTDTEQLAFHRRLQVTLDTHKLIAAFSKTLKELFEITSLEYRHTSLDITSTVQTSARHKIHYFLTLENLDLGELTLTRNKRFSNDELLLIEQAIGLLPCYLKNALEHHRMMKTAFTDSLTGMMNRAALDDLLPKEIERSERHDSSLSLLMIDLDHFKDCNDLVGHLGGDEVLRQVTQVIQQNIRFSDLVFRYGGEEFLVVLPHANLSGAIQAGELIRTAVERMVLMINGHKVKPSVSIGVATHIKGNEKSTVIMRADDALYQAKLNGRNCTYSQQDFKIAGDSP